MAKVAIIGGGPSGLAAAKACLEDGLVPTVFERDLAVGGLWKLGRGGRVWPSMRTNLSKHTCCFSDFRWPEGASMFPLADREHRGLRQKDKCLLSCSALGGGGAAAWIVLGMRPSRAPFTDGEVSKYMEDYAARFGLVRHLRLGHTVTGAVQSASGGWDVSFTTTSREEGNGCLGDFQTEAFDRCIVACGIFSEPYLPSPIHVTGITEAVESGWATHSAAYREAGLLAGKTVLVVGSAFSGAEIASDLAGTVAQCTVSAGEPVNYLPRLVPQKGQGETATQWKLTDDAEGSVSANLGGATVGRTGVHDDIKERNSTPAPFVEDDPVSRGSEGQPNDNSNLAQDGLPCRGNPMGGALSSAASLIPLDLALYSWKGWVESKAKAASAEEKLEGTRKFLLDIAGQDPGDAHEALRLDSNSLRPPYVTISDGFLDKVRDGSIEVRERLVAVDAPQRRAYFADNTSIQVDEMIFCTGYRQSLKFLSPKVLQQLEHQPADSSQPVMLQHLTWNATVPDLGFVGVYRGPYFGVLELQARWLTRMWSGAIDPPTLSACQVALQERRKVRAAHPRPQFPTDYLDMMEGLAEVAHLSPPFDAESIPSLDSHARAKDGSQPGQANDDPVAQGWPPVMSATEGNEGRPTHADGASVDTPFEILLQDRQQLMKWLWNGPSLPCHYRLREHLAGAAFSRKVIDLSALEEGGITGNTRAALMEAVAELRHVNMKFGR